jgi:hypothetical protein
MKMYGFLSQICGTILIYQTKGAFAKSVCGIIFDPSDDLYLIRQHVSSFPRVCRYPKSLAPSSFGCISILAHGVEPSNFHFSGARSATWVSWDNGYKISEGFQDHGGGNWELGIYLTSGPFEDSMSAAARPKRSGVFRQAKGQELDPTRVEPFTQLDGGALLRVPRAT